jgi:hypothetical protein
MVIRFKESADYREGEFSETAISLIRAGLVAFYSPDWFTVTEMDPEDVIWEE